jgi:hypothetical protein
MGDGFQIRVEDASLRVNSLAVAIVLRNRVEALGKLVLCFGGKLVLALENDDVVVVQRVADGGKLLVY